MSFFGSRKEPERQRYPKAAPYAVPPRGRRRAPVPDRIDRVYIPHGVIESTSWIMGQFGKERRECYVWWGGYFIEDGIAQVTSAFCPDVGTDFGRVELHMHDFHCLHAALRQRDQALIAELHTHPPGGGGQNEVDAAHAAAPYPGFITIVVPNFAQPYFHDLRNCYVYEYLVNNCWKQLNPTQIAAKFTVEESLVVVRS